MNWREHTGVFRRYPYLRYTFLLAIAVLLGMPLIGYYAVFPLYQQVLIGNTERQAIRIGQFLAAELELGNQELTAQTLPQALDRHQDLISRFGLEKLKLLDRKGVTLFSTDPGDIGKLNKHTYFHQQVARGEVFTKVAEKNKPSLEGQAYRVDIVETYIPIIDTKDEFIGAFELYFDITSEFEETNRLTRLIMLGLVVGGIALLFIAFRLMIRSGESFDQLREVDQKFRALNHQNEMILFTAAEGIFGIDREDRITFANPAAAMLLGWPLEQLVGIRHQPAFHHHDDLGNAIEAAQCTVLKVFETRTEVRSAHEIFWRKDGSSFPVDLTAAPQLEQGEIKGIVVVFRDITRQLENEKALQQANKELERLSFIDGLTGIANRRFFDQNLETQFRQHLRDNNPLSVLMIDIDYFKLFNDSYGHQAGDDCLKKVAQCFDQCIFRPNDFLARYGGEEFVLVLGDTDEAGARNVAGKALQAIEELNIPHEASEVSDWVTISLGIATMTTETRYDNPQRLLEAADEALYQAKSSGRNRFSAKTARKRS